MVTLGRVVSWLIRLAIRISLRLVPVVLWLVRYCVLIIFTYLASLRIGLPQAARTIADAWQKDLPLVIAVSAWGDRIYALYTLIAWVILLTGLVLQSLLIAWLVGRLL